MPTRSTKCRSSRAAALTHAALYALVATGCRTGCERPGRPRTGELPGPAAATAFDRDGARSGCVPGSGVDYPVGPGQRYERLADVPFEQLGPGDTVRIHARPEPYREKLMVGGIGRPDAWIRVCGVPSASGALPVLDGDGASTRDGLVFPYDGHQARGLVVVGHRRGAPWKEQPRYLAIEGLELRGARPPHRFRDRHGTSTPWADHAAGIYVQRASDVVVRGCIVHDNANGLFVGGGGGDELTERVLIEANDVFDNGNPQTFFQHNVYNEAAGVTYRRNRFGAPKRGPRGVLGANVKERSAGVRIELNWIEDGAHLLDLVDAAEARDRTLSRADYRETFVVGNVLVRGPEPSASVVHYGGDSGDPSLYRKGVLRFFHNTIVVENASHARYERTSIFELATDDEHLDARNNVVFAEERSRPDRWIALLGARDGVVAGRAHFVGDFVSEGIAPFDAPPGVPRTIRATIEGLEPLLRGTDPGFRDPSAHDFRLRPGSLVAGRGVAIEPTLGGVPREQLVRYGRSEPRLERAPSPGAFGVEPSVASAGGPATLR
jgi:hypothetical protein